MEKQYFFTCEVHNQRFPSITALKEHDFLHHSNTRTSHSHQFHKDKSKNDFKNCEIPKSTTLYNCKVCDESFLNQISLENHNKIVHKDTDNTPFQCHICSEIFYGQITLIKHFEYHTQQSTDVFRNKDNGVVNNCTKIKVENEISNISQIKMSSATKNNNSNNKFFDCHICEKKFKSLASRKNHIANEHLDQDFVINSSSSSSSSSSDDVSDKDCSDNKTKNRNSLDISLKINYSIPKIRKRKKSWAKFICYFCNTKFRSFTLLERHIWCHTHERPFKCNKCTKAYRYVSEVRRHSLYHENNRRFKCKVCKISFTESKTLTNHMLTHSNVRSHCCSLCSKAFKRASCLRRHVQCSHTDIRPFKCNLCVKDFKRKDLLLIHSRWHKS